VQAIDGELATVPLNEKVKDSAVALKRATFLSLQESDNPLPNLAEIRCYQVQKLLKDREAEELYSKILGAEKAKKLKNGKTEAEKVSALAKWLPKL